MANAAGVKVHSDAIIAEYSALRTEIIQMEQMQTNTFALQLTAAAVIFSFSLSSGSRTGFLLILPIVSYALSRRYLLTNETMRRLSEYITEELSPKVQGGFGWEAWNRERSALGNYGRLQLFARAASWVGPIPLAFVWISLAALAWVIPYILFQHGLSALNRVELAVVWLIGLAFSSLTLLITRWGYNLAPFIKRD